MTAVRPFLFAVVIAIAAPWAFGFRNPSVDIRDMSANELAYILEQMELQQQDVDPSQVSSDVFDTDGQGLGSVTAVDVDSQGYIWAFHRANRPWGELTFRYQDDVLSPEEMTPIDKDTIAKLDPDTGKIVDQFGSNLFNVPHGLTIDQNDNIWVTDVGRHQVIRFPNGSTTPDLELGEKFVPGADDEHFCKPTGVAVAPNGDFFVSDGYCNSRILKFSKDGKLIAKWGTVTGFLGPVTPYHFDIPHSLALVENLDIICVADRENQRATCFNAGLGSGGKLGTYNRTVIEATEIGQVFAIDFNKADGTIIAAGEISSTPYFDGMSLNYPTRAFTFNLKGELLDAWAPVTPLMAMEGASLIHDLCASRDGKDFFLADVERHRVLKYSRKQ